jgi:hypothetical protein
MINLSVSIFMLMRANFQYFYILERKTLWSSPQGMPSASQWDVSEYFKIISFKFLILKTFRIFVLSVKDLKTSLGTSEYTGGEDVRLLPLFEK